MAWRFFAVHRPDACICSTMVPKGFIPDSRQRSDFNIQIEAAQGTSYYQMVDYQKAVADIVRQDPERRHLHGQRRRRLRRRSGNNGRHEHPAEAARRAKAHACRRSWTRLRPKVSRFPGLRAVHDDPAGHPHRRPHVEERLRVHGAGPGHRRTLSASRKSWKRRSRKQTDVQDVNTDLQIKSPRVNVVVDRDRAAALGLDVTSIENALYDAYGPKWCSTIYSPTNQYRVLMEIQPKYQEHADYLSKIYFKSDDQGHWFR